MEESKVETMEDSKDEEMEESKDEVMEESKEEVTEEAREESMEADDTADTKIQDDTTPLLEPITESQQEDESQTGGTVNNSDDELEIPFAIDFEGNVIRRRKMFVKIKVRCQPSSTPAEEFHSEMAYVMAQFKAIDSRFLLAPYPKEVQPIPTPPLIHGPERLPTRVAELRVYFPNFYPRDNGGDYYVKALIGFDKPFDRVMEAIGWELRMKSAQIFENDLQVAETQKAGWFLWSLDSMALKDLEKELGKRMGHLVALRYGAINMGERMQFLPKEVPRAVYVKTEATNHVKTARYLSRLYHKSQTISPLNIKLRFASDMNLLNGEATKVKARRMAHLQHQFTSNVKTTTSWGITNLDVTDRIIKMSIREMILNIKSIEFPDKPLFLAVSNGHKNKAVTVFTMFPQMEKEAHTRADTLLPYLSHFYQADRVVNYFTPDEVEKCKECYWDTGTKQVTSPIDAAINSLADIELIDPEYIFDLPEVLRGENQGEPLAPVTATAIGFDSDSISTFHSGTSRRMGTGRGGPGRIGRSDHSRSGRGRTQPPQVGNTATTATSTSTSVRSSTSGVTMEELSMSESRIMTQVTQDNIRLMEQVSQAQTTMETRLDQQMREFLSSITQSFQSNTSWTHTDPNPTLQNPVTPNHNNLAGAPNQGSGQGR